MPFFFIYFISLITNTYQWSKYYTQTIFNNINNLIYKISTIRETIIGNKILCNESLNLHLTKNKLCLNKIT